MRTKSSALIVSLFVATLFSPTTLASEAEALRHPVDVRHVETTGISPAGANLAERFNTVARGAVITVAAAAEAPAVAVPMSPDRRFGAFGSVAISAGTLPMTRKFEGVTGKDYAALFSSACEQSGLAGCNTRLVTNLRPVLRQAAGQSEMRMLQLVNTAVNRELAYTTDRALWGTGDYWATPSEIALKGAGDCEDFAISKMWLLRHLGFPADRLQIVVLQSSQLRSYHAVLAVHVGNERIILDNLSSELRSDASYRRYVPIMSFVGARSYIHGFERKRSDLAEMPKDLASVMPGVGY